MVCVGGWGTCLLILFYGLFYLTDPAEEEEEEEVIRCICGVFRDEGLMIQCEKCLVSDCLYKWALDCRAKQLTHSCTNGTVERDMMFKKTTSCQCLSKSLVLKFTKSCLGFIIHSIIFPVFAWSLPVVKDYHFFSVFSVTGRKYFSHISKSIERAMCSNMQVCTGLFQIWQHCDCVQVSGSEEHYLCEQCDLRAYDKVTYLIYTLKNFIFWILMDDSMFPHSHTWLLD